MRISVETLGFLDMVLVRLPLLFLPTLVQRVIQSGISFGLRAAYSFACSSAADKTRSNEHPPSRDSELASHISQCILTDAPMVVLTVDWSQPVSRLVKRQHKDSFRATYTREVGARACSMEPQLEG